MRAGLYLRQSLDRDGSGLAIARQRTDCRKLAKQRGWTVVEEFADNDTSASTGKRRPGYERMLAAIEDGQVQAVVVWAADRLHRRPVELEHFIDLADRKKTALATVSGDIDLGTAPGRLVARLLGAVARGEMETKSARQRRANLQRAENGKPRFTRRPYGYSEDGHKVVRREAKELQRAARLVLAGSSVRDVVLDLNARGVPTSTGAAWTVTTLRRLLANPRHAGLSSYNGKVLGVGDWPAILEGTTHKALVAKFADPSRRTASTNVRKYLLSGLVHCGICGDEMFASPMGVKGRRWMTYRCRRAHLSRRLDAVDDVVEAVVVGRLSRPDAIALLAGSDREDVELVRAEGNAIRAQLDDAAALFADGGITGQQLRTITERLRGKLEDVERRTAAADSENTLTEIVAARDVAAFWSTLSLSRKRAVIDALMTVAISSAPHRGARFTPDQVQIGWKS